MRKQITAEKGAKPVGPYSHAIACQGTQLFVSGQGPVDPVTGETPAGFRQQAAQCMTNLKTIIEAAGASMADVVKVNAYLKDMGDFPVFNEVYRTFFSAPFPARTTVQSDMFIPIEMDAIVVLPE